MEDNARYLDTQSGSRVALLGTLGDLHAEPLRYDLACLRSLVESIQPDLLGVEVDPGSWDRGELGRAPVEVREALLPAARRTDTVIVPLAGPAQAELAPPESGPLAGLRASLLRTVDRCLELLQRASDGPEVINGARFGHLCGLLCDIEAAMAGEAGRRAWKATNQGILERLLWVVRRDPGRRILVAVQCRRVHWLQHELRRLANEIILVPYQAL